MGSAGVHEWLPEGRPERMRYERFVEQFGNDQLILISWDDCRLDDVRLKQYQESLRNEPEFSEYFAALESSDQLVETLTNGRLQLSPQQVRDRLRGVMIGPDGICSIVARITDAGVANQNKTIETVLKAADRTYGLNRDQLRLAGTVYEAYAVDQSAEASLKRLVLPSTVLGLSISWFCLQSMRRAIVVLVLAGLGQLFAVAMVYYSGNKFSAVLIVLPTLVFMLTLSGSVHLMNYHADIQRRLGSKHAGVRTLLVGWKPCALSSITTMLGMGSLITSQLAPVRQFGLFSAIGLGVATVFLLLGFPVLADWFCRVESKAHSEPSSTGMQHAMAERYLKWIEMSATPISLLGIALLILTFFGLSSLRASTKFTDMFPLQSKTNVDMAWMEKNLGPISTVEVLLTFPVNSSNSELERAGLVNRVANHLVQQPVVGGVLSAGSFLPNWTESSSIGAVSKRAILRKEIVQALPELEKRKLVSHTEQGETWRIMAKVSAISDSDYGSLARIVMEETQRVIQNTALRDQVRAEFTGLSPVMHETQIALLTDLGYSFLSAFVLITPVMMYIARSFFGGLLLMIPNVLPVTLAFGSMGWQGLDLDIAGILTASIALGIAVDDTLHFTCWYMEVLGQGCARVEAVRKTFGACAKAMFHTTLISCVSMTPFLFAEFLPTQQFAKLMIIMLVFAIVGDLFLLPALLVSPLGAVIRPRKT